MNETLIRCHHCGDVIGVYEPLVAMLGDTAHETSQAREPELAHEAGKHYHRDCYLELRPAAR